MEYTTNQKGLITEMSVALYLIKMGYQVSQPLNVDCKYDLLLDVNNKILKLQVKTSHLSNTTKNSIQFNCRSITGRKANNQLKTSLYTKDDIDYFATIWNEQLYLIPVEHCSATKTLHLSKENGRSTYAYAEDYKAEEVLKVL